MSDVEEIVRADLPVTRRYQELLSNKDIDCVVAAVPDHWHRRIVAGQVPRAREIDGLLLLAR